jgi:hypothetical protein
MIDIDRPEIKFALNAVRQASLLVKMVQAEMVSPALTKDDRSPVTIADFASQALVAACWRRSSPALRWWRKKTPLGCAKNWRVILPSLFPPSSR